MGSRIIAYAALSLTLAAQAALAADEAEYGKAREAAKAAQEKAASVGGEWRDIGKLLQQASNLAEEGDYTEAVALAREAERQGLLGYKQMTSQAGKVRIEDYLQ